MPSSIIKENQNADDTRTGPLSRRQRLFYNQFFMLSFCYCW